MKVNYQKKLEDELKKLKDIKPTLLIHSCCAPCNSYVLEYLKDYFEIIIYFYNPNINIPGEFEKRYAEQERYIKEAKVEVQLIKGEFKSSDFLDAIKGYADTGEGGKRCDRCYELRIKSAAQKAKELNVDYYTTSLTISPMKDAKKLNELGEKYSEVYNLKWLSSDFKKKGGYQESIKLSKKYNLYRQDYCGCSFSKSESIKRKETN